MDTSFEFDEEIETFKYHKVIRLGLNHKPLTNITGNIQSINRIMKISHHSSVTAIIESMIHE